MLFSAALIKVYNSHWLSDTYRVQILSSITHRVFVLWVNYLLSKTNQAKFKDLQCLLLVHCPSDTHACVEGQDVKLQQKVGLPVPVLPTQPSKSPHWHATGTGFTWAASVTLPFHFEVSSKYGFTHWNVVTGLSLQRTHGLEYIKTYISTELSGE